MSLANATRGVPPSERSTRVKSRLSRGRILSGKLPQHILQNPAMLVVQNLLRRIDPHRRGKLDRLTQVRLRKHRDDLPISKLAIQHSLQLSRRIPNGEDLLARKTQRFGVLSRQKLQRQNAH